MQVESLTSGDEDSSSSSSSSFSSYEQPSICMATWNNNLKVLQGLVDQVRRGENMAGYGPTHFAASMGNVEILEFLLEHGVDKDERDRNGNSALIWVVAGNGKEELMEALIDHGTNVNTQNFEGETALYISAQRGYFDKAMLLLDNGAIVNVQNIDGATPLHAAAAAGHCDLVELLVKNGAHLDGPDNEGDTPLHWAVREGQLQVVTLLVRMGSQINTPNDDGESPLELALCLEDKNMIKRLLPYGGNAQLSATSILTREGEGAVAPHHRNTSASDVDMLSAALALKHLNVHKLPPMSSDNSSSATTNYYQ